MIRRFIILVFVFANALAGFSQNKKPNIILFYVDDLGYGDVSCYGAITLRTPNVDKLADGGLRFTDAHCAAATCTPSRFSLLTGVYAFRNKAAILPGDAPLLFKPGTQTVATMLQRNGYATGVVGKWHLGLGNGTIDWNGTITPGPESIGFQYSFLIPATTDRVPTVYVENGKVPNLDVNDPIKVSYTNRIGDEPTGLSHPQLLKQKADTQHSNTITNGISRIGYMTGGKSARWVDEEIPFVLNEKAKSFIIKNQKQPFFLYYPFPNIHVPRTPNKQFVGNTNMGARGDVIVEMDWMVGEVMKLLDSLQLTENTLVIFTSDNGPVLDDGYADFAEQLVGNHKPSGIYRGGKYSAYEAGTRVPTIIYWKGKIKPTVSKALVSQVDFYKTVAALINAKLQDNEATDSENQLAAWLGKTNKGRIWMLEESYTFSLRKNNWKFIAAVEGTVPGWFRNKKVESGLSSEVQLYNLDKDPSEQKNLAKQYPSMIQEFQQQLNQIRQSSKIK
ncbi:arylsulfatase [Lacibacter sp.]|uniref:sulfatase family protein n=1 Tax=Lacibacter sp. TaxID=1915409 RepID=UPI002B4B1A28|nr:arylsulfatase [Lacibacter sp.]HLP37681.1 arylsulfatase [Lacibacter sp.]